MQITSTRTNQPPEGLIPNTNISTPVAIVRNVQDTKFHHSIASEPFHFDVYKEDAEHAIKFAFWLCHNLERDVWGCVKVDLNKFCSDMGYKSKTHFQEKVSSPHQLQGKSPEQIAQMRERGEFVFETRFHNMVYKMATMVVELKHKDLTDVKNEKHAYRFELLIKSIDVYIDKKNRNKMYLMIKPSDFFLKNLSQAYMLMSKDSFTQLSRLKSEKIVSLYIYLSAWRHYAKGKGLEQIKLDFNRVCNVIGVTNYKEEKHKKEKLKQYLTTIKKIATDLEMDFWFASNGKWAYKPIIIFKNNPIYTQQEKNSNRLDLFDSILTYCLTELFTDLYPEKFAEEYKVNFDRWLNARSLDREQKVEAYQRAHEMVWKKEIAADHKQVTFFFEHLKHNFDTSQYGNV